MLLNHLNRQVSPDHLIQKIGHDGSEIWWPELTEPANRRGFHTQELIDVALEYGIALVEIVGNPALANEYGSKDIFVDFEKRFNYYLKYPGLILGKRATRNNHLVFWDGESIIDPKDGCTYLLDHCDLAIESLLIGIKSSGANKI